MTIIRNSVLYMLSTGIGKGLPFLLLPLLTRFLSTEEFGILGVATVIVSILTIIIGFNPSLFVVTRFYRVEKNTLGIYIYNILLISIVCFGVIAIIVLSFPGVLASYGINQLMLVVLLLVSLGRVFISLGLAVLQMEKRALDYLRINILFAVPMFVLIYFLVVIFSQGWEGVLVSELVVGTVLAVTILHSLAKEGYIKTGSQLVIAKDFMRFSVPLIPHVLAFWVMNFIDRLFLAEMTDMETVGLYSTAYMLGLGMSLLHESIHRAWQPYFFEYLARDDIELKKRMVRYTWLYYAGSVVVFFLYVEVLRLSLPLLVGKEYLSSMEFVPLLVLGYTVLGMYRVVAGYLYHGNRTITLAMVTAFAALVNIVMNFVLIPLNGAIGAAQATLIAFATLFLVTKLIVVRSSSMPWIGAFRKNWSS